MHIQKTCNIVQNALFTRSRLSHFQNKKVESNYKFCITKGKKQLENVHHVIIEYERIQNFLNELTMLMEQLDQQLNVGSSGKIFSIHYPERHSLQNIVNITIQLAQKAIWIIRNITDSTDLQPVVWKTFKRAFETIVIEAKGL